jgi:hypothetical protein
VIALTDSDIVEPCRQVHFFEETDRFRRGTSGPTKKTASAESIVGFLIVIIVALVVAFLSRDAVRR